MSPNAISEISCLIIDDEQPAHEVLGFFIAKVPWLKLAGNCYNAIDALEAISKLQPDVIFLDVNMPELSGLDLLSIVQAPKSHIIMTTAYSEYAIDGFTYDVTAFLLKPVAFDRFLKAVSKARRLVMQGHDALNDPDHVTKDAPVMEDALTSIPYFETSKSQIEESQAVETKEEYMWIKADRKMHCVWFKDIDLIEGLKDYVKIHHKGGVLVTLASMTRMMDRLPSPPFVRTHRSFIVNRDSIKVIEGNMITMLNGMKVSIAVSPARDEVFRRLTAK